MKLISACLLGIACQYNGKPNRLNLSDKLNLDEFIPVCAEQLGGLPTPRPGSGILNGTGKDVIEGRCKVMNRREKDITKQFLKGAEDVLKIAKLYNAKEAILSEGSPSCGVNRTWQMRIEDGKVRNRRVAGEGVLTALLKRNGIKVISHKDFLKGE